MSKLDRINDLLRILTARRTPIGRQALAERLECSPSTIKRHIRQLRDELGVPIKTVPELGYLITRDDPDGPVEIPGLWFNAAELHALLTAHHLFSQIEPGILSEEIAPLKQRIRQILHHRKAGNPAIGRRVRIVTDGSRPVAKHRFRRICHSLVGRHRIRITYHARGSDQHTQRTVSPQRLTHYRNNWYLDAWCHLRRDMRSFALERITAVEQTDQPAYEISERDIAAFTAAYGIFSGAGKRTAILRFTPERARWLADEHWHPRQTTRLLRDGRLELSLPYDDPTELIMDILRYGPDVDVVKPASLRREIARRLRAALDIYGR